MALIEKEIKHFRILEKLGEGGIGVSFKSLDTKLDEIRTIEVIWPALARDADFLARFAAAAKDLARLDHPNLVAVHWFFEKPPEPFLVLEYVEGPSLAEVLRREGPLPAARVLPLGKQLLEALAYAHSKDIVHRDLKPSDVRITDDGRVKVGGFGLSKQADGTGLADVPVPVEALHYLSPEHVKRRAEVGPRSDLYAVGVILYEALTGRTPFAPTETDYLVLRAVLETQIEPPARVAPEVPEALSEIVMRALARDPADRFETAGAMLEALDAFEAQPPSSPPARGPAAPPPARTRGGRRRMVYGLALALAGTLALAWWALRDVLVPAPPPAPVASQVDSVTIRPGVYERILSSVGPATGRRGSLVLQAMPYGEIRLDGAVVGEDSVDATVGAGRRRLRFEHPLYGARELEIEVAPGQRKEVICYFEGYLRAQASDAEGLPLQAEVFVDDQATGRRTPLEDPLPLGPGTYTVEVYLEGYLSGITSVAVHPAAGEGKVTAPPVEPLAFVLRQIE